MLRIKDECTGCMACMNSCPAGAITPIRGAFGFVMPEINGDACIDCGICEKVCPIEKGESHILSPDQWEADLERISAEIGEYGQTQPGQLPLHAYAMFSRDEAVVKKSSSGGAFYTLAEQVIRDGGIVFGSHYDVQKKRAHLADTDHYKLDDLLTSKYVESYIGRGFRQVKLELDKGRNVLFCGTPCQAAGLKAMLRREYENLLLVDFTCGAVTADPVLAKYLRILEKLHHAPLKELSFRDKHYGWGQYCLTARFENGRTYRRTAMADPYFYCFLRSSMQRLSCHGCRFQDAHASDIVLADFWRCSQFAVDSNDRKGLSLVLSMTEKGQKALEEIAPMMHTEEVDRRQAAYNLKRRTSPEAKLEEIVTDQEEAYEKGVIALRNRLLTPKQRAEYAVRQRVMDHPELEKLFPGIVGNGQIVKK
ncbi:MAG: Coenzyme F420 hydrogenase/dehydrogenase, beta subunit C-terminal domain [Eubacteriales bacterium]|nr:Coenzyme F420 hydrogenase/dehydrogenase, beta subunit C-terminal domain [Eubacteriales bacterium]